jgi:hypothetical protein
MLIQMHLDHAAGGVAAWFFVKCDIAVRFGDTVNFQIAEIEHIGPSDAKEQRSIKTRKYFLRDPDIFYPFTHQIFDCSLQVFLRAAQIARNDRELLTAAQTLGIGFFDICHRADHDVFAIIRLQFGGMPLIFPPKNIFRKKVSEYRHGDGRARFYCAVHRQRGTECRGAGANTASRWFCLPGSGA